MDNVQIKKAYNFYKMLPTAKRNVFSIHKWFLYNQEWVSFEDINGIPPGNHRHFTFKEFCERYIKDKDLRIFCRAVTENYSMHKKFCSEEECFSTNKELCPIRLGFNAPMKRWASPEYSLEEWKTWIGKLAIRKYQKVFKHKHKYALMIKGIVKHPYTGKPSFRFTNNIILECGACLLYEDLLPEDKERLRIKANITKQKENQIESSSTK